MAERVITMAMISLTVGLTWAQDSYLNRPDLLNRVDSCLRHTYNFSFQQAYQFQHQLAVKTPDHPAPAFLEALIIYWENFPLSPEDKASERFESLMNRTVELAQNYIKNDQTRLEGVFFDLYGRAFKAMHWADNGKPGKVIPDLRIMFKYVMEGFDLKDQFSEFYFSTGLYNYYIEAYPEAHPVYKPLVSFMQKGDKKLGLQQLNHAINHSVYLRVESILFMSLIQLNYEEDLNTAAIYAEKLYKEFPNNIYYQGHLINILLHLHRYGRVTEILEAHKSVKSPYSNMIRTLANAFIAEKQKENMQLAEKGYLQTIELAESFGTFTDQFKAIGYMGLSRINAQRGLESEARRYARKASSLTVYSFILNEY